MHTTKRCSRDIVILAVLILAVVEVRTSKTELVRQGVDFVLQRGRRASGDALLDLIGQAGRVGRRDVSRRHDWYVLGRPPKASRPARVATRRRRAKRA